MIIKDLIKEINQGKNLEKNLPDYFNELMTLHNNAANFSMTFHFYTFIEMLQENDYSDIEGLQDSCEIVKKCIDVCYQDDSKVEELNECVRALNELREAVIAKMKVLTAYTDVFQIYEYIMNRLEGKYSIRRFTVDDEEFTSQIMRYIFSDQDSVTVNSKIQEIVGQLPVRMTKTRFLDLISDSLSVYQGSDKSSVETFLYMVRSGATLDRPEGYNEEYPQLAAYKKTLETADYKNLTIEEYVDLKLTLEKAVNLIEHVAEAYYTLQEVINDVYAVLLTKPYANMPGTFEKFLQDMPVCAKIITSLNALNPFQDKAIPVEVTSLLSELEGKQERLLELRNVAESIFFDVEFNQADFIESMMLSTIVNCLDRVMKLQSNSIFVELDREAVLGVADEVYMKRTKKQLLNDFSELLTSSSQMVSRAIMSSVLCKLPVFFNNQNEISDYVYTALSSCKDEAEKSACIQLIQEIIG